MTARSRRAGRLALRAAAAVAAACLSVGACAPAADVRHGAGGQPGPPAGELVVFATASLAAAFEDVAAAFTRQHPGVSVTFNVAGSQQLAHQLAEGASADVLATAHRADMEMLAGRGLLAGPHRVFARNRLAIAVEPGNPRRIRGLADLADPGLVVALAHEAVPAGRYAREALDAAGVEATAATLETDVRAVLTRVALGEADAGIVYATDLGSAPQRVGGVAIPEEDNVEATYPIAVLASARNPAAAGAFVDFVTGERGQPILADHGFLAP